eukprot:12241773-Heterocapsa_arctica.AAC.1
MNQARRRHRPGPQDGRDVDAGDGVPRAHPAERSALAPAFGFAHLGSADESLVGDVHDDRPLDVREPQDSQT